MGIRSVIVILLFIVCAKCFSNETVKERVLSRKKRFLVFPDGSSFQLVFCLQTAAVIPIGDIFLYSITAALAWNLPTDPKLLDMLKDQARLPQRRGDQEQEKNILYLDEKGKVIAKVPYKRRPIVNPAMAKRSVNKKEKLEIDRELMHASQHKRGFLKSANTEAEFHRSGRATLYPKIEAVLRAMGSNGGNCVLRTLCQVGQTQHHPQGSFFQEIMRAVFTLPKGSDSEDLRDYDTAHSAVESCEKLYPDCDDSPANDIPTFSY